MIKKFYPYLAAGLLLFASFGSINAQDNTPKERPWWLGLNGGAAWQKGDVRARLGYGLGLTLERSLIYNNKSLIGMSLRGRYLYSSTSGQDYKRSTGLLNNEALNGTENSATDYNSSLGYVYQNYKTSIHDFDLELLLNTNRLRARKGVNFYIFGGIGSAGSKTSIDQLDEFGNQYDYNSVSDFSKNIALLNLNNLKDKKYETDADGSKTRKYVFAPSFGGGLSFRLAPNFWMGFEHKVTFPKTDLLDGQRWNNDNSLSNKNDLYHYTNMNMNIGLFGGSYTAKTEVKEERPFIELLFPTTEVYDAIDCKVAMSIRVHNVTGRTAIEVRQDGAVISDYTYSASGVITFSRTLTKNVVFVVSASNSTGVVSKSVQVNCAPQVVPHRLPSPIIDMIYPKESTINTTDCSVQIQARLQHLDQKQSIAIEVDGRPLSKQEYSYYSNGALTFNVHSAANTVVVIKIRNAVGEDSKVINVRCAPVIIAPVIPSPEVTIVRPSVSPFVSSACYETIVAKVKNVTDKSQISIVVNNNPLYASLFDFNPTTQEVSFNANISKITTIQIFVFNEGGKTSDMVELRCQPPVVSPKTPTVEIRNPAENPFVSASCEEVITAFVTNVPAKENIQVLLNGYQIPLQNIVFDKRTNQVAVRVSITGTSVLVINVNNPVGGASDKITLVCGNQSQKNIPAPVIHITKPAVSLYSSATCEEDVIAFVKNVSRKENIHILIGKTPLTPAEFTFDQTTGRVDFHAKIYKDEQISVEAVNEVGKAHDGVSITCVPVKPVVPLPTVQINSPSVNPYISISCEEDVVALVRNVSSKDKIQVVVNGAALNATGYSFDAITGKLFFHLAITSTSNVSINVSNESGKATDAISMSCAPKKDNLPLPTVQITSPSIDPFISVKCEEDVFATVRNVSSKEEIKVLVNGIPLVSDQYTFDPTTGRLNFHLSIKQPNNVVITASNATGVASDKTTLSCAPPKVVVPVPTVQILSPTIDPYISLTCSEDLIATVRNVKAKENILILVNNVPLNADDFTFDQVSGKVAMHLAIKEVTTVVISATNESGTASDKSTMSCNTKRSTIPAPTVQIITPSIDPYISLSCEEDLLVIIRNVKSKDNIKVTVNTVDLPSEDYSFEPTSGKLTFHLSIQQANQVTITAINETGIASDKVTVSCVTQKGKVPAPTVLIMTPTIDPYISISCDENVTATIRNVKAKENIFIVVNGITLPSEQFSFEPTTGQLAFHLYIKEPNAIVITATNESGVATDKVTITCAPPKEKIPAPTVQVTKPSNDPYISIGCEEDVTATIRNVTSKSKISITVNNSALLSDDFMFDVSSGLVSFHLSIKEPSLIVIKATNESGEASDKTTITCAPPKEKIPAPTVQITKPTIHPYISIGCEEDVIATVRNVSAKEKIQVIINNLPLSSDQFTFDPKTGNLSFHLTVKDPNSIVITATNESGVASDNSLITCAPPKEKAPLPTVQFTAPSTDPFVSVDCEEDLAVFVRNVKAKEDVAVLVNGVALTSDNYTFDASTGRLTFHLAIKQSMIVSVMASNESGSASDKITINCLPPKVVVPIPTVKIITPTTDPFVSVDCEENVVVSVKNVTDQNNIKITINGHPLYSEQYSVDPSTKNISFSVKIDKTAIIAVSATNESGTATDNATLTCTPPVVVPVVVIPTFVDGNDCPETSPAKYVDCESCHSADDAGVTSITVDAGKKVCIKGTFTGQLTMNGGMLVVCGSAKPSSINFNAGTIVINGDATFGSLNLNNSSCTVRNFGKLTLQGTTFNGRMENYGSMYVGSDCNVNTQGIFKNTGDLIVKGSVNNGKTICNSGSINIGGNLHNNSGSTFVNSCKVLVTNEFHNNSVFDNNGYIKVGGKSVINGGSTLNIGSGNKLETKNLDFNGSINGVGAGCSSVLVAGQTTINGGAGISGKVSLCDENGIEQNNSGGKIVSMCTCELTATDCVPANPVVVKDIVPIPTVLITAPTSPNYSSVACEETISATVKNLKDKGDLQITVNDIELSSTDYSFDLNTGKVSFKTKFSKPTTVVITATNESGKASDRVVLNCTAPKTDDKKIDFVIDKGSVVPKQCYNASVVILGCALKEGGVGADYPVMTQVKFGSNTVDPFGVYSGYNKASNVNDHVVHTWDSPAPIPANTAISVKAKSINPKTGSLLYERNSAAIDPFVRVLRHGEVVPIISGFAGQADVEVFLKGYIVDGKVNLESNQAIYLFELGTNSATSKSNDMQDCVVLVTLTPVDGSVNCSAISDDEDRLKKEAEEKRIKDEADKKLREQEAADKLKREEEEAKANEKLTICHKPPGNPDNCQNLTISRSALQAHLDHGDHLGGCTTEELSRWKAIEEEEKRKAADAIDKANKEKEAEEKLRKEKEAKEEREKAEADKANEKITICHKPPGNPDNCQNLTISRSALQAHLDHGDHLGECTEEEINKWKKKEEEEKKQKADEEAERIKKASDALEREKKEKEAADEEKKLKEAADKVEREKAEVERLKKAKEDAERKEEADRQQKLKDEADRIEREKADEERKQKAKEDAERKEEADKQQKIKDESDRIEREKAEEERKQKAKEDAERKEEAEKQQKIKDEEDRIEREKADVERQKKASEEAERKEEAEKQQKIKDEADRVEREKAEAERQAKAKEDAEKKRQQLELLIKQKREKEALEKEQKEKEEAEKKEKEESENKPKEEEEKTKPE